MLSLSIVIVNWNTGDQLRDCISSIGRASQVGFNLSGVVVVDNGSSDTSFAGIDQLGVSVRIIHNKENRGFAAACNQGATKAEGELLLFLNPDTRLLENSLSEPIGFMCRDENSDIGICGIQLLDESGNVARSCARFPSLKVFVMQALGLNRLPWWSADGVHMIEWDHKSTRDVDHVIGAFFLVRRIVYDTLGGFDERFFVYLEDLDFSLRAHNAGWRCMYLAHVQAFHVGGGTTRRIKATRLFYSLRSRLLYAFKHFSKLNAWLLLLIMIAVEPCSRLSLASAHRSSIEAGYTLGAYRMLMKSIPKIIISNR
jgi:N-acetylglucosaminyl-diphospho-decaprenol L-rhamnosyltransferase